MVVITSAASTNTLYRADYWDAGFCQLNVGGSNERNQLALDRLACAGFKVNNPLITTRQYLRFAGTDSQRASDLQNIATGAIKAAPKLLLGVRGGYGAVRLLPMIDWSTLGRIMEGAWHDTRRF